MFRKLAFLTVAAVGLMSPLALVSTARADAPPPASSAAGYRVYYRNPVWPVGKWKLYGTYANYYRALAARDYLNGRAMCHAVVR
jgi:hypothetical protein